jgi:Double zinc ribbon
MNELDLRRRTENSHLAPRYHKRDLGVLVLIYGFAVALMLAQADAGLAGGYRDDWVLANFGGLLLLAELVSVLVMDWRGVVTLRGRLKWPRLSPAAGCLALLVLTVLTFGLFPLIVSMMVIGLGILPMFFGVHPTFLGGIAPILLGVYLALSVVDYRESQRRKPLERQRRIAELEAQLGILPGTTGDCPTCSKPLQLGANYCAYCRSSVSLRPLVCPNCATTTAPDAVWCPTCGRNLGTVAH